MRYTFKAIVALLLSLMLALSMCALADSEVVEAEEESTERFEEEAIAALPETDAEAAEETLVDADVPVVEISLDVETEGEQSDGEEAGTSDEVIPGGEEAGTSDDASSEGEEAGTSDEVIPDAEEAGTSDDVSSDGEEGGTPDDVSSDGEEGGTPDDAISEDEEAMAASVSPEDESASPEGEALEDGEIAGEQPVAKALVYNGELQALVDACEGWLFSTDGAEYDPEPPVAINAGAYTVYCVPADDAEAEPIALTVIIDKADVTLIPPEALI